MFIGVVFVLLIGYIGGIIYEYVWFGNIIGLVVVIVWGWYLILV